MDVRKAGVVCVMVWAGAGCPSNVACQLLSGPPVPAEEHVEQRDAVALDGGAGGCGPSCEAAYGPDNLLWNYAGSCGFNDAGSVTCEVRASNARCID